jgi:hypothetical protein
MKIKAGRAKSAHCSPQAIGIACSNGTKHAFFLHATWDDEDGVWVAEGINHPVGLGFATEAAMLDTLVTGNDRPVPQVRKERLV